MKMVAFLVTCRPDDTHRRMLAVFAASPPPSGLALLNGGHVARKKNEWGCSHPNLRIFETQLVNGTTASSNSAALGVSFVEVDATFTPPPHFYSWKWRQESTTGKDVSVPSSFGSFEFHPDCWIHVTLVREPVSRAYSQWAHYGQSEPSSFLGFGNV